MPYIPHDRRGHTPETPGELNYVLTGHVEAYRHRQGDSYQTFNDIVGALEAAKLEFYRRVVAPYEDCKRAEHGDVYGPLE